MMKYIFLIIITAALGSTLFSQNQNNLEDGWYYILSYNEETPLKPEDYYNSINQKDIILPISSIIKTKIIKSKTRPYNQLYCWFDEKGKKIWFDITKKSIGKPVCFIINGKIESITFITVPISNGKSSIGGTKANLKKIKKWISSNRS